MADATGIALTSGRMDAMIYAAMALFWVLAGAIFWPVLRPFEALFRAVLKAQVPVPHLKAVPRGRSGTGKTQRF